MTTLESPPAGRNRSAAPERVPVPTRQRRPGLAALAVVLILGGAALSGYLAITSGNKQSVVVLARDVPDGQLITGADLTTESISAPGVSVIPGSQLRDVASRGYRARGTYPRGTILNTRMLLGQEIPGRDFTSAAVAVPDGQYPPDAISPGSVVKVIYTPSQNAVRGNGGDATEAIPGLSPGATLIDKAQVSHVQKVLGTNGGGTVFTLIVPNDDPLANGRKLANLALANAFRAISMVKLPASERAPTSSDGS